MKIIKDLAQHIREELCDAQHYAKDAIKYKDIDAKTAQAFYDLSKEELDHAAIEHEQASRIIKQQKEKNVEIPESMSIVWQWQHEHMIDTKARILSLLQMFK